MKKIITLLSVVLLITLNVFASGPGTAVSLNLGLLSFYGYSQSGQVVLEWEAMGWATAKSFTVERSADGISWSTIKEIPAAASSSSASVRYSVTDESPITGNGYYRIGLLDDMGLHSVSNPVRVYTEAGGNGGVSLYPNPCTEALQLGGLRAGSLIVVRNAAGREIFRSASDERLSIGTGGWQSGVYFVSIATPDGRLLQRSVVRR